MEFRQRLVPIKLNRANRRILSMMKGIVLIAVGGEGYLRWAVNMAASIKYHSPLLPIQLLASKGNYIGALSNSRFFDLVTLVEEEDYRDEKGRLFPAKLKTSFIHYVDFAEFIYLDVDGCILKDLSPLFEKGYTLATDLQGVYDRSMPEPFNHLKWAKPKEIWEHFGLEETAKLPAINSSFLYIKKSDCVELFDLAHDLLMNNPLPYEKHWYVWGRQRDTKVSQPDELYLNVAMAKLGLIPQHEVVIYFRMINDLCEHTDFRQVANEFYGIGLFGQLETNHRRMRAMYNDSMKQMWTESTGLPFYDNAEKLSKTKFAVL